jgi:hypothetical protein
MIPTKNKDDGSGARGAGSVRQKNNVNGHCNICGDILLEIPFIHRFSPSLVAHVCNNIRCTIFASPQFYTDIPADQVPEPKTRVALISFTKPSYSGYLKKRKQNYRRLRDLGVDSVEACRMTSNKQTRAYVESKGLVY